MESRPQTNVPCAITRDSVHVGAPHLNNHIDEMRSREDPKIRGTGNKHKDDTKTEVATVAMTRRR